MFQLSARQTKTFVLVFVAAGVAGISLLVSSSTLTPRRFAIVEPGRVYRSGEVTPRQLDHLKREYGIRTVLSLLNPEAPETVAEKEAAERLGLRWVNVPLPGSGASRPEDRARIKEVLLDPDAAPLLVHCAAGTNRTGLAIGLYRLHQQHWTVDQVLDEMRRFDFEDLAKHENLRQALYAEWQRSQSPPPGG